MCKSFAPIVASVRSLSPIHQLTNTLFFYRQQWFPTCKKQAEYRWRRLTDSVSTMIVYSQLFQLLYTTNSQLSDSQLNAQISLMSYTEFVACIPLFV